MRHRHRSCMLLILPIECFVQNIHTKGQEVNLDLIKEENIRFLFVVMYF